MTPSDARSFGKKVQHAIKASSDFKIHAELVPLRNLLAHAKLEIVTIADEHFVVLRVADLNMAMMLESFPKKSASRS